MKLLFVCIENSCRSQIAEAFARMHGNDTVEAYSAGSRPSGLVNPMAIEAMLEKGYDLSAHQPKGLDRIPNVEFDCVITMGCGDECPFVGSKQRFDWDIPDPKDMSAPQFSEVVNLIESKVIDLLSGG